MQKLIGVLVLVWVGGWLIGCIEEPTTNNNFEVQESRIDIAGNCETKAGEAVSITLRYGDGMPSDDVKILYRQDDGEWKILDEHASGSAIIQGTAGEYEIKAQMDGHIIESALVIVPSDESCTILKQEVEFNFLEALCSDITTAVVRVKKPEDHTGLTGSYHFPGETEFGRLCEQGRCIIDLYKENDGTYEVKYSGFPNRREMRVESGIVAYVYTPVEILVSVGGRTHHIVSEAVDTLHLKIPYGLAESGCYEVDFYKITAETEPILSPMSGVGAVKEKAAFHITDAASPGCSPLTVRPWTIQFSVDLPAGTPIANVQIQYWKAGNWHPAGCAFHDGEYLCTVDYTNPLIADRYHVQTIIGREEYIGAYIPLDGKCIVFE